jgi:hypothetical protein
VPSGKIVIPRPKLLERLLKLSYACGALTEHLPALDALL